MAEYKTEFRRWCAENGYTARLVADKTGLNLYTVYAYFSGKRYPSRRTIKKLEEAFGVSMRDKFPY